MTHVPSAMRLAITMAGAVLVLQALAPAAGAEAAGPTNARSRVLSVRPEARGARIDVVGGDAFLRLRLADGHEAEVPGYGGEPYLRFSADGRVEVNRRSPAAYLNADRRSGGAIPAEASQDADPLWREVASGGEYAWHDHRIHWMGSTELDRRLDWAVPLRIDGRNVEIRGDLAPVDPSFPFLALVLGLLAAVGGLVVARRFRPGWPAVLGGVLAAALAGALAWSSWSIQPPGAGASPLIVLVPLVGAVAAAVAAVLHAAGKRTVAAVAVLAAVATSGGWVVQQLPALWHAIVPGRLPTEATQGGLGFLAGLVVAGAVLGVRSTIAAMALPGARAGDREDTPAGRVGAEQA